MSMKEVRARHNVPAKRGVRVKMGRRKGVILRSVAMTHGLGGWFLRIRFDDTPTVPETVYPPALTYLEP